MMNLFKPSLRTAILCACLFTLSGAEAATRPKTKPLTAVSANQVETLYRNKTWLWTKGGAYFGTDGRFVAWSAATADAPTYANGRWYVTSSGTMCFDADWHTSRETAKGVRTCFAHAMLEGTIYQSKQPSGRWFAFKHATVRSSDEFKKLVTGDRVSARANRIEASFPKATSNPPPADAQPIVAKPIASTATSDSHAGGR
jgi:hypothetical protein